MERSLPGVHFIDDGENRITTVSSAAASNSTVAASGTAITNTAAVISSLPQSSVFQSTPSAALPVITSSVPRSVVVSETKPKPTQVTLRQPVQSAVPTISTPFRPKVEESAEPSMSASASSSAGQSLIDFLEKMDIYKPTIPESVVQYQMQCAGLSTTDPRVAQLIALASQKFISDIVNDAFIHQNIKKASDKKPTLTMDALAPVLGEYGFKIKKPTYMQ